MAHELEIRSTPRPSVPTVSQLLLMLKRQRWVILGAAVVVAALMLNSGILVPSYVAQMKILVLRHRVDAIITPEANNPVQWSANQVTEEDLNSEVEMLTSDDLLRSVAKETGLDRLASAGGGPEQRRIAGAAYHLAKQLKAESIRKTDVISVQYESDNPELARKVLTALSEAYIAKHQQVLRPTGEFTFFDQQASRYREALLETRQHLADLGQQSGIVSPDTERDLTVQKIADFDNRASQAQEGIAEGKARLAMLQQQLAQTSATSVSTQTSGSGAVLSQMKATLSTLQLKRTQLLDRYTPTYSLVKDLDSQIKELQAQVVTEESAPPHEDAVQVNPTYQALQLEVANAQAELRALEQRASKDASLSEQYRKHAVALDHISLDRQDIMQEAKAEAENYVLYRQRREEARISDALDRRGIVNVAIVQQPSVPSFPKKTKQYAYLMTALLCFTCSISAAFAVDLLATSIRTPEEAAHYLEAPVLAYFPGNARLLG